MRLFRWGVLACAVLSLGGCAAMAEQRAARQAALRQSDANRCQNHGFAYGTDAFAICMIQQESRREEIKAAERMIMCQNARNTKHSGTTTEFATNFNEGVACN